MLSQPVSSNRHILVIGGNGGIGRQCVELGLSAGYLVTTILWNPSKLTLSHPNLDIVQGNVTKSATILKHLSNEDAIISAIGSGSIGNDRPTTLYSQGAVTVLAEMKKTNARRIFFISSAAIEISPANSLFIRFMEKYVMGWLLKHMFEDIRRMEPIIKTSEADWTIIRPPFLTNGAQTGRYRYATNEFLPDCTKISRADLAHFIIHHIADPSTFRTTIEISY